MMESVTLPPRVRRVLIEFASDVLGTLTDAEVPAGLRKVRTFAPLRRARAGAAPLAMALDRDETFRRLVAAAWRTANPELAELLVDGVPAPVLDPELIVAGLYLGRPEGWEQELDRWLAVVAAEQSSAERGERVEPAEPPATDAVHLLQQALLGSQTELAAAEAGRLQLEQELAGLKREQRRLRSEADRARSATREAERVAAEEVERLTSLLVEREDLLRRAERLTQEAQEALASVRRSAKDGRSLGELRARLLLDTIVDSASALRRELALPPAAQAPADLVAEQLAAGQAGVAQPVVPNRGLAADDPALLAELLRIPRAHLVVDGYNVTMEGYGGLPLVDQRRLLVDALVALAARTFAEITCCFDGAEVDGRAQTGLVRGVRVLFSDPGMTADELIRRLVRAEPRGRMLVVVSSDREVADAALGADARPVPSRVLLRLIGAGQRDRKR